MRPRVYLLCLLVLIVSLLPRGPQAAETARMPEPSWSYIRNQLKLAKFSEPFIQRLAKEYETKGFEEVVRLNVLLFLKKSDYHGPQINEQAVSETASFNREHRSTLALAKKRYGVSPKVVASLLYLESRYGKNSGDYHVPSVYLHLVQAPRTQVKAYLLTQTGRYTESVTAEQKEEIGQRTHKKARFALQELHALERIFKWNWKMGPEFRGSFSGAFGMPQFLPSSYLSFSRAIAPKTQPDLNQADDAIMSVAFYLRQHGWRPSKIETHHKALMEYNNSSDYANAILALAEKI